jgi:hypothetical protein
LKIRFNISVIATENRRNRNREIAIPPKINIPLPIGFIVVANAVIQRNAITNKAVNPHIHALLGMEGKNNAHLLDRYIIAPVIRASIKTKKIIMLIYFMYLFNSCF